jgi:hypothetical protein
VSTRSSRPPGGASAVTIPSESELRRHYNGLAGYRLLVTYLERFTLTAGILLPLLHVAEQGAIRELYQVRERSSPPRPWKRGAERRRARPPIVALALAWVLMEYDNRRAVGDRAVTAELERLERRRPCDRALLLRLSYVPRALSGLLGLRAFLEEERREGAARAVRAFRQLERRDRPIPAELDGLPATDRHSDRQWWKTFGLDKESRTLASQGFWTPIVVPAMDALGAQSGREPIRPIALDVARLLRVRYADLPTPDAETIRKRWIRVP